MAKSLVPAGDTESFDLCRTVLWPNEPKLKINLWGRDTPLLFLIFGRRLAPTPKMNTRFQPSGTTLARKPPLSSLMVTFAEYHESEHKH
jgi:hypothetical protein